MPDFHIGAPERDENVDLATRIRAWYEERPAPGLRADETPDDVFAADPVLAALHAELPRRARVADLGCGGGRAAAALASAGREVVGIDVAMTGLLHAESRRRAKGGASLSFVRGNLLRPPLAPGTVDAALLLESAEASGSPEGAVAAAAATLTPHGYLVLRFARTLTTEAPGASAHTAEEALDWLRAAGLRPVGAEPALSPLSGTRPLFGPHPIGSWLVRQLHAWRAGTAPPPQTLVARR